VELPDDDMKMSKHVGVWIMSYTITLCNFVVPMCSVWWVILFRETGVVRRITFSFSDFLSLLMFYLFIVFFIQ